MPAQTEMRKAVRLPYGGVTKLARRLGVTPSHLSHYLRGRPSRRLDAALQQLFGVTREELQPSRTIAEAQAADTVLDVEAAA